MADYLRSLARRRDELLQLNIDESLGLSNDAIERAAQETLQREMAEARSGTAHRVATSLSAFSKYSGQSAANAFLDTFEAECRLSHVVQDGDKFDLFPSLITGARAAPAQQALRRTSNWDAMKQAFLDFFVIDKSVVIAELKALNVSDFDVDKYVDQFNATLSKYPMNGNDELFLKDIFVNKLPFKVKESLALDGSASRTSLTALQNEAKRRQKTLNELHRNNQRPFRKEEKDDDKEEDTGTSKLQGGNQGNRRGGQGKGGNNQGQHKYHEFTGIGRLFHRMHVPIAIEAQTTRLETVKDIDNCVTYLFSDAYSGSGVSGLRSGCVAAVMDHLVRVDRDAQTGGRKLTAKDLMSEAERILHKTAAGMSFYERLLSDVSLRRELFEILQEMEMVEYEQPTTSTLVPKPKRKLTLHEVGVDTDMNEVPIQVQRSMREVVHERFTDGELEEFKQYYGAHPDLLEGFNYVANSEGAPFLVATTGTKEDLSIYQPVRANLPTAAVKVNNKYKVRVIVDTGSTSTIMSSALLDMMPDVKKMLEATSLTYYGVDDGRQDYKGILKALPLQLADNLNVTVRVGIVNNKDPYLIVGQDVYGGAHSSLRMINWNTDYSCITLVDVKSGRIGNMHLLKNIEMTGLPRTNAHCQEEDQPRISQLFRR